MQNTEAKKLLQKYKAGLCTEEEKAVIESWYLQMPLDETELSPDELTEALNRVEQRLPFIAPKHYPLWQRLLAASVVIGILSIGGALFYKKTATVPFANNNPQLFKTGKRAILTLAGGRKILLSGSNTGQLATQGNVTINKTAAGEVQYQVQAAINDQNIVSAPNNITTPRGGQYQLQLADGTSVWLNASSSITYPVVFNGSSREVSITGEVYFEVAKDKTRPFRVMSGAQTVQVLGTHFNINSFHDNGPVTETTLLEGSVKVSNGNNTVVIKPGQQAQTSDTGSGKITVVTADTEDVVAWRKGDLQFDNENIRAIMKKVSRLYDMDIVYEGKMPDEGFGGAVSHAQNVAEVLDVIQKTCNVHFKVEGRRIVVMP